MINLSIVLSDQLAKDSHDISARHGLSIEQFIQQAVTHEIANFRAQLQHDIIIENINAMKNSDGYLKEAENVAEGFDSYVPKIPKDADTYTDLGHKKWNKENF